MPPKRPQFQELEPRILYSADLAPQSEAPTEAVVAEEQVVVEPEQVEQQPYALLSESEVESSGSLAEASDQFLILDDNGDPLAQSSESSQDQSQQRLELVFINSDVDDAQVFLDDLEVNSTADFQVFQLDDSSDGWTRIFEALDSFDNVDAIHFITHGEDATFKLGDLWINPNNLNEFEAELRILGLSLSEEADLLIYGCDVAQSETGRSLLNSISNWTGADVAASDDLTGHASLGGDWDLEYAAGVIESDIAVSASLQQSYQSVLAAGVIVDATSTGTTTGSSVTVSHTTSGSNRLMLVGISIRNDSGAAVSTVTYNGSSLSFVGMEDGTSGNVRSEIWSLTAPDTGTHDLIVNLSGTNQGVTVGAMTFTGVDQTTPLGSFASSAGTGSSGSTTVSSATGELVFGAIVADDDADADILPGTGQTEYWDLFNNRSNGGGSTEAGAASVDISWSGYPNGKWAIGAVSIKPAINIAPVLTPVAPNLTTVTEDQTSNSGDLVSSIVGTSITDANTTDPEGIAITATNNSNGTWEYWTDGGTVWTAIGTVSDSSALLLDAADKLRFVPDTLNADTATITYRAWDQFTGTAGTKVDVSTNGSDTAFSTATDTASITITAVNDAPSFGANGDGLVTTAIPGSAFNMVNGSAVQDDGKIIVVGSSSLSDWDMTVIRYNTDGSLDSSFGDGDGIVTLDLGGNEFAFDVAIQSDGKILLAGQTDTGADVDFAVVRLNTDGSLDTSFHLDGIAEQVDFGGDDNAGAILLQSDGEIVVAGDSDTGGNNFAIARYDTSGFLDASFGTGGTVNLDFGGSSFDMATSLAQQADGKLVVGGLSNNQYALARLNVNGTLDTSFDTDGMVTTDFGAGSETISALAIQGDGKIIVGGTANLDFSIARYNTDGSLDTSFGTGGMVQETGFGGTEQVYDLALQDDGKILIAGYSDVVGTDDVLLKRYDSSGNDDPTFNAANGFMLTLDMSGNEKAFSINVLEDGSIIAAGSSSTGGFLLNKYTSTGQTDTSLGMTTNLLDSNPTFVEDGAAVILDADVMIYDIELSQANNFSGATLNLSRNSGADADDSFSASGNLSTLTESGNLVLSGVTVGTVTTNSNGTLLLTFNANATQARVNETLQSIAYSNSSNTPPASVQINWVFDDGNVGAQGTGGALNTSGSTTVNITAVNDAPTVSNLNGDSLAYSEGDGAVVIEQGADAVIADVDSADFNTGTLTVVITAGGDTAEDVLSIRNVGTGAGQVGVSGANVSYGGTTIGSFAGGSSGTPLTITFNASATPTTASAVMQNITYENTDIASPTVGSRTVTFTITDGDGGTSAVQSTSVVVSAVNGAPTATNLSAAESYTEDTALNLTDIVVTDVDSVNVTVTLTLSDIGAGSLNTGTSGAVTSTFVGGVWTASGAVADVNTLLSGVTFTPTTNYNSNFNIATSVSDGVNPAVTGSKAFTGTAVNDSPSVATNTGATVAEGSTGSTITTAMLNEGDVDDAGVGLTYTITTLPVNGTLRLSGVAIILNGTFTQDDIDNNRVTYDHDGSQTSSDSFDFSLADGGEDGATAATGTFNFTVTNVNDAPVNTVPGAQSVNEDTSLSIGGISVADADDNLDTVQLSVSNGVLNVTLSGAASVSAGANGSADLTLSGTQTDINATIASLTYQGNLNFNGSDTLTVLSTDTNVATDSDTIAITINAVDDAPTATNLSAAESYTEDTALNLTDIVVTDVDSVNVTVTLTLSDIGAGSLNTGTSGAVTSTFVGGVWTASGAVADVNTLLSGVTFTPTTSYTSNFTIATSVDDGVAAAITGTKIMTGPLMTTLLDRFGSASFSNNDGTANFVANWIENDNAGGVQSATNGDVWIDGGKLKMDGDSGANHSAIREADLSEALSATLSFSYVSDFTGIGDDFAVSVSDDGGSTWTTLDTFTDGTGSYSRDISTWMAVDTQVRIQITNGYSGALDVLIIDDFQIAYVANVPPTASDNTVTTSEDTDYTFAATDFGFSDTDGGSFDSITVTSLETVGALKLNGADVTLNQVISKADIDLNLLVFTPVSNANGAGYDSFDFSVNDGVSESLLSYTMTIDVAAVDDAPTATNLSAAESYTEDSALNLTDIVVTDVDSNVTVTLTLSDTGAGSLNTGTSGAVTSTFVGGVWTANGAVADVNTLLAGVTFTPTAHYNSNFSIATSVSDGVNPAVTGAKAFTGTAVNDVPSFTTLGNQSAAYESGAHTVAGFATPSSGGGSDESSQTFSYSVSNDNGALFSVAPSIDANGQLTYTVASGQTGTATVTVSITDSGGTANGGVDTSTTQTFDITVAVNTAPTITAIANQTINEDANTGALAFTVADAQTAAGSLTVTAASSNTVLIPNGSLTLVDGGSGNWTITATPDANMNGSATITVTVDDGTTTTDETFDITVTAVNDEQSLDTNAGLSLNEGATATITGAMLDTSDIDNSAAQLTYSVTSATTNGQLELTTAAGVSISSFTQDDIDNNRLVYVHNGSETTSDSFDFSVDDLEGTANTGTFSISVTLQNENAPFVTAAQTFSVSELAADGFSLGNAVATDVDNGTTLSSWTITGGNTGSVFAIDGTTGEITVADNTALDFDTTASYTLSLMVSDGTNTSAVETVTINVTDVATAITAAQSFSIAESATNGSTVGSVVTTGDAPKTFSITGGNTGTAFAIDNSGNITVADASAIDYETLTSYTLTIQASDGTTPVSETVTVTITDVNENTVGAISDSNVALDSVAENSVVGTTVGITALATDPDGTDTVTYSLSNDAGGRFTIDSNSGVVTVNGALNAEVATSHSITVLATSTDTSSSSQSFTITVTDVDEFDVGAVSDSDIAINTAAENATVGAAVGITASASDTDVDDNITYSLSDDAGGLFTIDGSTGVVTVASALDYESATSHNITVLATSDDTSTSSQVFSIAVTDVNENAVSAISDTDGTAESVAEDAVVGTAVGITALASDADATLNTISYSLTDDAGGLFTIGATSGVVTVNGALNFEAATSHSITIRADSVDGSFNTQSFVIAVNDMDEFDVSTISDMDASLNAVDENASISTSVGITANASDADGSLNTVSYSLSDDAGRLFSIDGSSGVVTVAGALDYESATSHNITVVATSADSSTSSATFTVQVNPLNDNGAVISDQTVNLSEDASIGSTLFDFDDGVSGSDLDADGDALSYSLSAGNDDGLFAIDPSSGVVTLVDISLLDYESSSSYILQVEASDGSFTSSAQLTIQIANMNEAPVVSAPGSVSVDEDIALDLGSVSVSDPDSGALDIEVTVTSTHGVMSIGNQSSLSSVPVSDGLNSFVLTGSASAINQALAGLVFTPDANFNGEASVSVVANDLGNLGSGSALSDSEVITITVIPVNDESVLDVPDLVEILPGKSIDFSTALDNMAPLRDLDSQDTMHNLSLSIENATLSISDEALLSNITLNDGANLEASGDIATINEILNALVITPEVGFSGDLILDLYLEDEGGIEVGSTRTLSTQVHLYVPEPPIPQDDDKNTTDELEQSNNDADDAVFIEIEESSLRADRDEDLHLQLDTRFYLPELVFDMDLGAQGEVVAGKAKWAKYLDTLDDQSPILSKSLIKPVEFNPFEWHSLSHDINEMESLQFTPSLQAFINDIQSEEIDGEVSLGVRLAEISGVGFVVSSVVWILKGSSLLASLLVSYPAWRGMDPLPVLLPKDNETDTDDAIPEPKEKPKNHRFQLLEPMGNEFKNQAQP